MTAAKALLISPLVQVPFLILLNQGHSAMGAIGYGFYYPVISVLDRFSKPWGYGLFLQEVELFVFQSLFLGAIVSASIVLKNIRWSNLRTKNRMGERESKQ
jgi:hypothetical protein